MGHSLGRREVNRHIADQPRIRKARDAGFTLVEIMVVVVIIGIVAASVVLSVGVTGADREVEKEGERALALMTYAREQAELQTRELGLLCQETGYQFLRFDPRSGHWIEVGEEDDVLRTRKLPGGVRLELIVEGRPVVLRQPPKKFKDKDEEDKNRMPHIMIFSNGDLTPFELALVREGGDARARIRSTDQGTIEAIPPEEATRR